MSNHLVSGIDKAPLGEIWLWFISSHHQLYVIKNGSSGSPITAYSGGGQTTRRFQRKRVDSHFHNLSHHGHGEIIHTSSQRNALDPKIQSDDKHHQRGGTLPPGSWTAYAPHHPHFRKNKHGLGEVLFWLKPSESTKSVWKHHHSTRLWDTFYMHSAGWLGSDGCIVMDNAERAQVKKLVGDASAIHLRCDIWPHTKPTH